MPCVRISPMTAPVFIFNQTGKPLLPFVPKMKMNRPRFQGEKILKL